jgi:hypothetical protein
MTGQRATAAFDRKLAELEGAAGNRARANARRSLVAQAIDQAQRPALLGHR